MAEINDNTTVEIPLRNLVALGAGLVMATTAYVTLNTRITQVEQRLEIQDIKVGENANFVREWPLGLRGSLPADLRQDSNIIMLKEKIIEINDIEKQVRVIEIDLGRIRSQTETQEQKIETIFEIYNNKLVQVK